MKKFKYAIGLAAMAMFGACSSDAPELVQNNSDDNAEAIGYLRISLQSPESTRATETATLDEKLIDNISFIFTDVNGNQVERKIASGATTDDANVIEEVSKHKGEKCYVVKLTKMMKSVACIVNGEKSSYENVDLNTNTVTKYAKGSNTDKYFYMSSAKTYDGNHNRVYATPITTANIYTDYDKAEDNTGGTAVKIYLERYVAKMEIANNLDLTEGKLNPLTGTKATQVSNATITFEPKYVAINNTRNGAYTIKQLPTWEVVTSAGLNSKVDGTNRSYWVGDVYGNVHCKSQKDITKDTYAFPATRGASNKSYEYESRGTTGKSTGKDAPQVVVLGKYTVTPNEGETFTIGSDGTFYLIAFDDTFRVVATEADAIKAMNGDPDTDVLVADGATDETGATAAFTNLIAWQGWTGWMKLKGDKSPVKCIKYNGGYGYYTKSIERTTTTSDDVTTIWSAIVRNHYYKMSIDGITGMGVGIIDPDQPLVPVENPDPKTENYYLHMNIEILEWESVATQSVTW